MYKDYSDSEDDFLDADSTFDKTLEEDNTIEGEKSRIKDRKVDKTAELLKNCKLDGSAITYDSGEEEVVQGLVVEPAEKGNSALPGVNMAGEDYDKAAMAAYYTAMAEDIKTQKERIGGDWAIAHVVMKNEHRAALRKCLGSQLYLVNLVMSTEDRRKRVLDRHMGDEGIGDMMDVGAAKNKIINESSLRDSV